MSRYADTFWLLPPSLVAEQRVALAMLPRAALVRRYAKVTKRTPASLAGTYLTSRVMVDLVIWLENFPDLLVNRKGNE